MSEQLSAKSRVNGDRVGQLEQLHLSARPDQTRSNPRAVDYLFDTHITTFTSIFSNSRHIVTNASHAGALFL